MAPRPPAGNCVKIEHIHTLGDANVVNVQHWQYPIADEPLTAAQIQAITVAISDAWDTHIMALVAASLTHVETIGTDLFTLTGAQYTTPSGVTGSVGGAVTVAQDAMVVKLTTALRGRSFRGRQYVAGIPAGNVAAPQQWTAGSVAAMTAAWAAYMAEPAGIVGFQLVESVVSYFEPPTVLAGAIAPGNPKRAHSTLRGLGLSTPVTSAAADVRIGSSRRRAL